MRPSFVGLATATCFFLWISDLEAGSMLFSRTTDTISVAGQTVLDQASTYEAQVLFTSTYGADGSLFNEWKAGAEDKALLVGPTANGGYNYQVAGDLSLYSLDTLTLGDWHHVAFVYDGSQQRLYIDGQLRASEAASGSIRNSDGLAHIGAIFRDGGIRSSFIGYVDSLRISNVGRYFGSSFSAPVGDFSNDANTLLLYNFNEAPGGTTVTDLSGHGRTGTLGVGFNGATSPTFVPLSVPEPMSLISAALGMAGLAGYLGARAGRKQSPWSVAEPECGGWLHHVAGRGDDWSA